ncbi:MAG: hypothetical protein P1U89_10195 [Verrucomicrobiales bacterium]|nr:hypothetical protein [Verrucomicrobiales bacterium]
MEYILHIKVLHLVGAFCLFAGIGGLFGIGENRNQINRAVASLHGLGLLLLFLTGFAMQGLNKAIVGFPMWLTVKIVLWIAMVLIFVFIKRAKMSTFAGIIISILIGGVAAYLCLFKPF